MGTFRIVNVTNIATGGRGHFLQMGEEIYKNKIIAVGASFVVQAEQYEHLPHYIMEWADKNWIKVHDLDAQGDSSFVAGLRAGGEITPSSVNPIKEMKSRDIDKFGVDRDDSYDGDEEINFSDAVEVKLPDTHENTRPINQSTSQMTNAKISPSMQEERHSTDLSPIPGERPVELDNSEKFTIKAPRAHQQGSVVKY